jgi:hypothetical protein
MQVLPLGMQELPWTGTGGKTRHGRLIRAVERAQTGKSPEAVLQALGLTCSGGANRASTSQILHVSVGP